MIDSNYINIYILVATDSKGAFEYSVYTTFYKASEEMDKQYNALLDKLKSKYYEKDYYSVMWRDSCYIVDEVKSKQYDWHIISLEDKF